jgi:hypothetical protein
VRESVIDQEVLQRYHAVRILYRVKVDNDGPLQVMDVDGSSDTPSWHALSDLGTLQLTPVAEVARRHL